MKKLIAFVLALICALGLVGCSPMNHVPALEAVKEYSAEEFDEQFNGVNREGLVEVWGDPAGNLSKYNADTWDIDDQSMVIIYWKENGKFKAASIRPIKYHGKYINDSSLLVINSGSEIENDGIIEHYENGGMILVTNWAFAEQIQATLSQAAQTSLSANDAAVLFYKTERGTPGVSVIGGIASNWDSEIDEMITEAKERQKS